MTLKPNAQSVVLGSGTAAERSRKFGFVQVADYRLYGLDGVKKVASAEWIEADDDETAIEAAKNKMNGQHWELWHGLRLIARRDVRRDG